MDSIKEELESGDAAKDGVLEGSGEAEGSGEKKSVCGPSSGAAETMVMVGDLRMESLREVEEEKEMDSGEAAKDGSADLEAASPVGELGSGEAEGSGAGRPLSRAAEKMVKGDLGGWTEEGAGSSAKTELAVGVAENTKGDAGVPFAGEALEKEAVGAEADVESAVESGDGNASSSVFFVSFEDRPEATAQQWELARTIWRAQEEKREMPYKKLSDEGKRVFFFRSVREKVAAGLLVEQEEELEDDDDGRHAAEMAAVAANVAQKRKEFYELVRSRVAGEVVQDNASLHSDDHDGSVDS
ncbi:unnamed protein product [Caenorhabditis brenneri]